MANVLFDLAAETNAVLTKSGHTAAGEIGGDLAWAAFNLGAAFAGGRVAEHLAKDGAPVLQDQLGQEWDVLEVAAMSLAFGNSMTALDLCSDAVLLFGHVSRPGNGRFHDLGALREHRGEVQWATPVATWIDALLNDGSLAILEGSRHALIHRRTSRTIALSMGNAQPTARELSQVPLGQAGALESIGTLIPKLTQFAEYQFRTLCVAFTA